MHHGTFAIDKSRYKFTVDRVNLNGHYYSSKPPIVPTYTAGVYYFYHKLTGHTFRKNESEAVFVCTMAAGLLSHRSHLVTMIYLLRLARRMFERELAIRIEARLVLYAVEKRLHRLLDVVQSEELPRGRFSSAFSSRCVSRRTVKRSALGS